MSITESVFFGTADNLDEYSFSHQVETAELQDGLAITNHVKTISLQNEASGTICDAWGIAASLQGDRNSFGMIIESASYSLEELVSDPCMDTHPDYLAGGSFSPPNFTKVLMFYHQHIWLGVQERIDITFRYKGTAGLNPLAQQVLKAGAHITGAFVIGPAAHVGAVPTGFVGYDTYLASTWPFISVGATDDRSLQFYVDSVKKTQREDWHSAEVSLVRRVDIRNPDHTDESPLRNIMYLLGSNPSNWKPNADWLGHEISDITMYKLSTRLELSQGANATCSESIEIFPASSTDGLLDLTTS